MDIFPFGLVGGAIALVILIFVAAKCFFTIHTKQAAVIEKFGKFERIAGPGLNFKIPAERYHGGEPCGDEECRAPTVSEEVGKSESNL